MDNIPDDAESLTKYSDLLETIHGASEVNLNMELKTYDEIFESRVLQTYASSLGMHRIYKITTDAIMDLPLREGTDVAWTQSNPGGLL